MLPLLLLLVPPSTPDGSVVPTLVLGKLPWDEARRLDGRAVRVSFLVSGITLTGGGALVEPESPDSVLRCVRFPASSFIGSMASGTS